MAQNVKSSKKEQGFSFVEVLVALLIMQLVLLFLMEAAVILMNTNVRSKLRDIAVAVTEDEIDRLRGKPFTDPDLTATVTPTTKSVTRTIGKAVYTFVMTKTIIDVPSNPDLKTVQIVTTWSFLGADFSHNAAQLIKR